MEKKIMQKAENLTLNYIGLADFDYPVYQDQNEKLWFDTNFGRGCVALYSSSNNALDGEPNSSIDNYCNSFEIIKEYKENPRKLDYMMLSRLISDCDYCINSSQLSGKIYEGHLYYKNVTIHISEMKKLYNSFSENEKPEWCSLEKIEEYERKLSA